MIYEKGGRYERASALEKGRPDYYATSGAFADIPGANIYGENYNLRELRNQVGLVFQYPEHQLFEVNVLQDVCFGPKNQGLSKEEAGLRAFEAG